MNAQYKTDDIENITPDNYKEHLEKLVYERTNQLKEMKERFQVTFEHAALGIAHIDINGKWILVNNKVTEMLGYSKEELCSIRIQDITYPDDIEKSVDLLNRMLKREVNSAKIEKRYIKKDKSVAWVSVTVTLLFDQMNNPKYFISIIEDIAIRKKMEQELSESNQRFDELVTKIPVGVFRMISTPSRNIYFNFISSPFCAMLGLTYHDIMDDFRCILKIIHNDDVARLTELMRHILIHPEYFAWDGRFMVLGDVRWLHIESFPTYLADGNTLWDGISIDITDHKRSERMLHLYQNDLEQLVCSRTKALQAANQQLKEAAEKERKHIEQLMHADKMARLGLLISGITHEINNPNNFISLNAKIMERAWKDVLPILETYYSENGNFMIADMPYSEARQRLNNLISGIGEGSERIKRIVQNLKNFIRKEGSSLTEQVFINDVVRSATMITDHLVRQSTSRYSLNLMEKIPPVNGNSQQLEQVIINLITNACEALETTEQAICVRTCLLKASGSLLISVFDQGRGISPENMHKISNPFFTTKQDSGGTGLGLSVSLNIVKQHRGTLKIYSRIKKGTVVIVTLPIANIKC